MGRDAAWGVVRGGEGHEAGAAVAVRAAVGGGVARVTRVRRREAVARVVSTVDGGRFVGLAADVPDAGVAEIRVGAGGLIRKRSVVGAETRIEVGAVVGVGGRRWRGAIRGTAGDDQEG